MPFTTLLWRGIAIDGDRYVNVYSSFFDGPDTNDVHSHARNLTLRDAVPDPTGVDAVARFSKVFYGFSFGDRGEGTGDILIHDLRMGATPDYVFTFKVAESMDGVVHQVPPSKLPRVVQDDALDWLWTRIFDETTIRQESSTYQAYAQPLGAGVDRSAQ